MAKDIVRKLPDAVRTKIPRERERERERERGERGRWGRCFDLITNYSFTPSFLPSLQYFQLFQAIEGVPGKVSDLVVLQVPGKAEEMAISEQKQEHMLVGYQT